MDDPVFGVYFLYVLFVDQKGSVAAHKIIAKCLEQIFNGAEKFNLSILRMENDFMDVAGSLKE